MWELIVAARAPSDDRELEHLGERLLASRGWPWDSPAAAPLAVPPARVELVGEGRAMLDNALFTGRHRPSLPVRRGQPALWRTEFTPSVAERFRERFGDAAERLGYAP